MSLTVCMVVYNEEKHLSLIDKNICILRRSLIDLPILLIDNASTDQSSPSLQEIAKKHHINYLRRDLNHLPQARQMAVDHCQTDWLGFVDADCLIDENWLNNVVQKIQNAPNNVAALGGPWQMAGAWKNHYESLFSTFLGHFGLVYLRSHLALEKNVKHLPTANIVYRRNDLVKVGGFKSKNWRVGEDLDLSHKLRQNGFQILFYPQMKIEHYLPTSVLSWAHKMFIYGQARGEVLQKYNTFSYVSVVPFFSFLLLSGLLIGAPTYFAWLAGIYFSVCWGVAVGSSRSWYAWRVFCLLTATHFFYSTGVVYGFLKQMWLEFLRPRFFLSVRKGPASGSV